MVLEKNRRTQAISDDALFDYETASVDEIDEMAALLESLEVDSTIEVDEPDKGHHVAHGVG